MEEGMIMQHVTGLLRLFTFQAKYNGNPLKCFKHWEYMLNLPVCKKVNSGCNMDNRLKCLETYSGEGKVNRLLKSYRPEIKLFWIWKRKAGVKEKEVEEINRYTQKKNQQGDSGLRMCLIGKSQLETEDSQNSRLHN